MSSVTAHASRDPRARHEGGFDRWSFASRSGWEILWRDSDLAAYALGDHRSVWVWDQTGRIWSRVASDIAGMILREHERTMRRLRRAVLVVRLLNSELPGEREAARAALQRIATAIAAEWQLMGFTDPNRNICWFDHPASVYVAVTQDCRHHLPERERMAFDPALFAELAARAEDDFRAGRRAQPPRLRPNDLVYLQVNLTATEDPPSATPAPEPSMAEAGAETGATTGTTTEAASAQAAAPPPEPEQFSHLRAAVADGVLQELQAEATWQRRRRLGLIVGGLIGSALLIAVLVGGS